MKHGILFVRTYPNVVSRFIRHTYIFHFGQRFHFLLKGKTKFIYIYDYFLMEIYINSNEINFELIRLTF